MKQILVLLSKKISNYSPTFSGISTVGSIVTVKITQNGKDIAEKTTTVDSSSRFNVVFTNKLPRGSYKINIFSTNNKGDYIEIPEFDLKVTKIIKPTVQETTSNDSVVKDKVTPAQTPLPIENTPKTKHCFLWWCW